MPRPTFLSKRAQCGFKLVRRWQPVVWFLKKSHVKISGFLRFVHVIPDSWIAGNRAQPDKQSIDTQTCRSPYIPHSGTPIVPSPNLLRDVSQQVDYTETTVPSDVPKPNAPATSHSWALSYTAETADLRPQTTSVQNGPSASFLSTPDASALHQLNFEPAKPSFRGSIQPPEGKPCGGGSYSDVFRRPIQFVTPSKEHPTEVAVKVLRRVWLDNRPDTEADERLQQRLQQEVKTWLSLPEHQNIVPLIGWTLRPNLSLISPWYSKGNLFRNLKSLSGTQKLYVLLGIAKGLDCLHSHSPPVVHGDLKPENILLSDQGEPLLADFGLSTIMGEEKTYTTSHRFGGSVPWMSPECIEGGFKSPQSDVYSFGTLAFTVLTGRKPYAGLTDTQVTIRVSNSKSPNGPVEDWSKYPQLLGPFKELLMACWSWSPSARPSMSAVVERLTTLVEANELDSGSHTLSQD